jgi:hypothetical protein
MCFVVCPQNAKQIADGTELVRVLLCAEALVGREPRAVVCGVF